MKTKRFRLLTIFLTIVMLLALSLNVYAAQSNAVTQDGITAQLFTDKDAYKAGEKVNANVQVTNNTGYEIFVLTQIKIPEGMTLASGVAAQDALLADGGVFNTSRAIVSAGNAVAGVTSTGDNMQAGFWVILSALGICSIVATFVYGKNKKTWLSMFLCMVMVGGLMVAAVPAQAADKNGDIALSCIIQVDGKDAEVSATISYTIYEDAVEEGAPIATEAPIEVPTEPTVEPTATPEPTVEPTATPEPTTAPTEAPTATPNPDALVLHVSVGGQAVDGCREETHYADIKAAQTALRSMDHSDKPVEVLIHAGTYQFDETVTFEAQDSGRADYPVAYKAAGDGEVYFTGSTKLDATSFSAVSDEAIKDRLPENARDHVVVISLAEYGITSNSLDLSKRYTVANAPLGISYLYVNGLQQNLSRYPNADYEKVSDVIEAGDTYSADNGKRAVFAFDGVAPYRWTEADQAYIVGYLGNEWCRDWIPMDTIDTNKGTITLGAGTAYGIGNGAPWFVTNLLEEIDLPGEFFVDAKNLKLYWYPTEELSAEDKVELTVYDDSLIELLGVNYVEFNGIHFQHTLADGLIVGSSSQNSSDIIIRNCKFNDCESSAIKIYGARNLVEGCTLYECGLNTIEVNGGGDPATYTASNNRIANNHFWDVARQGSMQYKYAISLGRNAYNKVIGDVVEHNIMHGYTDGTAVIWGGLDNVIRYNEIYSMGQYISDNGLVYCGRKLSEWGNVVEYNYFHDFGSNFESTQRIQAIYLDDTQSGQTVKHNIIVPNNTGNGAGDMATGAYNTITENIVANSFIGVHMSKKDSAVSSTAYNNLWSTSYCPPAVSEKYPQILEFREFLVSGQPLPTRYNVLTNNLCVNVAKNIIADEVKEWGTVENNQMINDFSVFVNPDNHDYRLKAEAVISLGLPDTFINENNFNMDSIGIQTDVFAVEKPESAFKLIYPVEGETIQVSQIFLKWEKAFFADEYEYVIATDKDMTNVVVTGKTYDECVNVEGLTAGQTYYYTVQAKNLSKQIGNNWANTGGARSFTVGSTEALDMIALNAQIKALKELQNTITIGTNSGEYKAEVSQIITEILGRAEAIAALTEGEQATVDAMTAELRSFITGINGYKNISYVDIIDLSISEEGVEWESYLGKNDNNYITATETTEGGVMLNITGAPSAYLDQKLDNSEILRFKMRVSYTEGSSSYMALALRHKDLTKHCYKTQHAYALIVKEDEFELQKYPKPEEGAIVLTAENNGKLELGKWHDIEFGAVDVVGGVQITLKIDGIDVLTYMDENAPNYGEGYFTIYTAGKKSVVEFLPYNSETEPETQMTPKPEEVLPPDGVYYENAFDNEDALINDRYLDRESGLNDEKNSIAMYTTNAGISRLNMQIGTAATNRTLYVDAKFDETVGEFENVDADKMNIQTMIIQPSAANQSACIKVQYPYSSTTGADGVVSYDMNTLFTMDETQKWTVGTGEQACILDQMGRAGQFEFRIDMKNGTYTVWYKATDAAEDAAYTQLSATVNGEAVNEFTLNSPISDFKPSFVRIFTEDLDVVADKVVKSYINNVKVYAPEDEEPVETGDGVYYAANFDDLEKGALPESLNPVVGGDNVSVAVYKSSSGAKSAAVTIKSTATNRWAYVQPKFDEPVSDEEMIVELRINRSNASNNGKVVLSYPYAKADGNEGNEGYYWNDLLSLVEDSTDCKLGNGDATAANTVTQSGYSHLYALKINLKTGNCTAYTKTADTDGSYVYTQLGSSFTVNPLQDGFNPEFIRIYTERKTGVQGTTRIDNFAVYAGSEFKADEDIPWNQ